MWVFKDSCFRCFSSLRMNIQTHSVITFAEFCEGLQSKAKLSDMNKNVDHNDAKNPFLKWNKKIEVKLSNFLSL